MDNPERRISRLEAIEERAREFINEGPRHDPGEGSASYSEARTWCVIVLAYNGLEQSLKAAYEQNDPEGKIRRGRGGHDLKTHDLKMLVEGISSAALERIEYHYREWNGFIEWENTGAEAWPPETARAFIEQLSETESDKKGWGSIRWRYWALEPENDEKLPWLNDLLMMAIWKGATEAVVAHHDRDGSPRRTVFEWLEYQLFQQWQETGPDFGCPPNLDEYAKMLWAWDNDRGKWQEHFDPIRQKAGNWKEFLERMDSYRLEKIQSTSNEEWQELAGRMDIAYFSELLQWLRRVRERRLRVCGRPGWRRWIRAE